MEQSRAKTRRKVWIWIASGLVGVIVVAVLGVSLYLTPERLRRLVLPALEESLQRKVELQRVGLRLWGGLGASVEGLSVADRKGFGADPFISAERAALSLELWPLLKGEAGLGAIVISEPSISLVIDEKGEANYADLAGGSDTGTGGGGLVVLPVERLTIENGRLRYEDRQAGSVTEIQGLDYRLAAAVEGARITIDGVLAVAEVVMSSADGTVTELGRFRASHRLAVGRNFEDLDIESLQIGLGPAELVVDGTVQGLSGIPQLTLNVEEQKLDLGDLAAYLREAGLLEEDVRMEGALLVDAKLQGSWDPEARTPLYPRLSGKAAVRSGTVQTLDLLVPIKGLTADLALGNEALVLSSLSLNAGRSDLSLTGQVRGILDGLLAPEPGPHGRPSFGLDLVSRLLDLDEMLPVVSSTSEGTASGGVGARWGFASPAYGAPAAVLDETSPLLWVLRAMDGEGSLNIDQMKSDGVLFRSLRSEARAEKGVMRLQNLMADVLGGRMTGQVKLDARGSSGNLPVEAAVSLDGVEADGLLAEFLKLNLPIQGRMGLSIAMSGAVDSTLELVQKAIRAEGSAHVSEGKVVNWPLLRKVTSGVSQLGFMNFDEVPIRSLLALFRVADERIYLNKLNVKAADMDWRLGGSSGMDGSLDLTVDVDVPASRLNIAGMQLGQTLQGLLGGAEAQIPLRIHIGGTVEDPQVKAQLQPRGAKPGKQEKGGAQETLKDKGKGLLRKFF